jgi:predicted PhzF superfamily epimerase YddE/YHI9
MAAGVAHVHVLRVFTDKKGKFGNGAGIIIDEKRRLSSARRLTLAKGLGYEESVYINDIKTGDVTIYNSQQEIEFAGHAMVGAAWLLAKLRGEPLAVIHCTGGNVKSWQEAGLTWVRASLKMMPPWQYKQLATPEEVARISPKEAAAMKHTIAWAWIDEAKGLVRARSFASDWDIPEVEGNGSGSLVLAAKLWRAIEIKHDKGSIIYARPSGRTEAELGGRVVEDRPIEF